MNDDLDNKSDAELNELFAVEAAGYHEMDYTDRKCWRDSEHQLVSIAFCTDANAVLVWLNKCDGWQSSFDKGEMREFTVDVWAPNHGQAEAESFPKAAVIALLRAKRATP